MDDNKDLQEAARQMIECWPLEVDTVLNMLNIMLSNSNIVTIKELELDDYHVDILAAALKIKLREQKNEPK